MLRKALKIIRPLPLVPGEVPRFHGGSLWHSTVALNECTRLLQELHGHKHCQIYSPTKNRYHQNPFRQDKSYLDQPYSVTKLLTVALQDPDIVQIEYNTRGKYSGTKKEKKFDVAIGFPNKTAYYPYPMCSVIKFELDPTNQSKFYCEGKPTVLMRYTLSQDYTFQNIPGKVLHKFTNSSLPNHADCFFDRQNTTLDGSRTNPIYVYQYCNLTPVHLSSTTTNPPKPTSYKPNIFPRWGQGTNPKKRRCPRWGQRRNPKQRKCLRCGWGRNPKQRRYPRWGWGTNPKQRRCPRWGWGTNPK